MSAYPDIAALKASIDSTIFSNTTRAVTGDILRDKIKDVVDTLEAQDASLSTLISNEVSRAVAAESSLTTRVSIEESTRLAQDALKLDKSGGTVTGALNVNGTVTAGTPTGFGSVVADSSRGSQSEFLLKKGGVNAWKWAVGTDGKLRLNWYDQTSGSLNATVLTVDNLTGYFTSGVNWNFSAPLTLSSTLNIIGSSTFGAATFNSTAQFNNTVLIGSDTSSQALRFNGPAGAAKGVISWRTLGALRSQVYMDSSENIKWDDYGDSAEYLRTWLTHTRLTDTTTLTGALTADTITNYASEITITALLALTPAQSAKKRIASVTGAYRLDGTIGRVLAQWDGDSSAGAWRISGTGVSVTENKRDFAASLAANVECIPVIRNRRIISLPLDVSNSESAGGWASVSGAGAAARHSTVAGSQQLRIYQTGSTSTGYSARAATACSITPQGSLLYRASIIARSPSDAVNTHRVFAGFIQSGQPHVTLLQKACFLCDPQDTLGLGINTANWWAVTATSAGLTTMTDTGVVPSAVTNGEQMLEVYLEAGVKAEFRIAGALVAAHTTNLPDSTLHPSEGIVKTAGTAGRDVITSEQHFVFLN